MDKITDTDISPEAEQLIRYAGLWRDLFGDDDDTDTGYQE